MCKQMWETDEFLGFKELFKQKGATPKLLNLIWCSPYCTMGWTLFLTRNWGLEPQDHAWLRPWLSIDSLRCLWKVSAINSAQILNTGCCDYKDTVVWCALLPVRRHGSYCHDVFVILSTSLPHLAVFSRHFQSIRVARALTAFGDDAPYKFMFYLLTYLHVNR